MTNYYLRPTAFVDTPVGFDGQVARLAGGLLFHAAYELIDVQNGRVTKTLVPVSAAETLPDEVQTVRQRLSARRAPLDLGSRTIRFDQPQVAAILNVTPDSFSDGGMYFGDAEASAAAGVTAASGGAAIIDVGGESTRPGSAPLWEGDEIARVVPVIERLARAGLAVSIDSRKAAVMEAALAAGAAIVNDVSGLLHDDRSLSVVAAAGCPIILMHAGDPHDLHVRALGPYPLLEVYDWLEGRIAAVEAAGIARSKILIDPGIGFGKTLADNLALLNGLALFQGLGCALMLGASRKRMIGALSNEAPADARLGGSVALALHGAMQGAQIVRVHDVPETVQALRVWRGLRDQALTA